MADTTETGAQGAPTLDQLSKSRRIWVEARLRPIASSNGERFFPTNFPDLGAALHKAPKRDQNGSPVLDELNNPIYEDTLLVESLNSMANHMEMVCWKKGETGDADGEYNEDCRGIPFVKAEDVNGTPLTASPLEAHRLASPYIWETVVKADGQNFLDYMKAKFGIQDGIGRMVQWKIVAKALLEIDPGCLLHGVWFSDGDLAGGKVRLSRTLSGFIEARNPQPAHSGFNKRDAVSDRTEKEAGQTAESGFGSVIGPIQEFTSADIRAGFQIDVGMLRGYGLDDDKVKALVSWALYKIHKVLLERIGNLRSRCQLELDGDKAVTVTYQSDVRHEKWKGAGLPGEVRNGFNQMLKGAVVNVKWHPKIQGKADIPEGVVVTIPPELKEFVKVEPKKEAKGKKAAKQKDAKPSNQLLISGEFTEKQKVALLNAQQGDVADKAKEVVERAYKDYRDKWDKKLGNKPSDQDQSQFTDEASTKEEAEEV